MAIFISPGTRNARDLLRKIDKISLDKFLERNFDDAFKNFTGSVSSVNQIFQTIGNTAKKYVQDFSKALSNTNDGMGNLGKFLQAIEKQAKSAGTKSGGLFYKLIYTKTKNIMAKDEDWKDDTKLRELEKQVRIFLLAKKDGEIDEGEKLPEEMAKKGLEKLTDDEKKDQNTKDAVPYKRKSNSHIIEKLKSGRLSNQLKVFMALVLWNYIYEKLKEEPQPQPPNKPLPQPPNKPQPQPQSQSQPPKKTPPYLTQISNLSETMKKAVTEIRRDLLGKYNNIPSRGWNPLNPDRPADRFPTLNIVTYEGEINVRPNMYSESWKKSKNELDLSYIIYRLNDSQPDPKIRIFVMINQEQYTADENTNKDKNIIEDIKKTYKGLAWYSLAQQKLYDTSLQETLKKVGIL